MMYEHPNPSTPLPFPLPAGAALRYTMEPRSTDIVMVISFTPGAPVGDVDVQLFGPDGDPNFADALETDAYLDTLSDGMKRIGHYAAEYFEASFQDMDLDTLQ